MIDRWFWQPDSTWVNTVNTTNLRSVQGIRMATALVATGLMVFAWASWHAVPHCAVEPCPESISTSRAADFALGLFETMCIFVGALLGIAVAGFLGKRATDTEHVERKEAAKAATKVALATAEHQALTPTVTARHIDKVEVTTENGTAPLSGDAGPTDHEWASGDPKAGLA